MVEIYKGELRDLLLAKNVKEKPKLELRMSQEGHVHIKNVVMRDLENMDQTNEVFEKGLGGRQVRKTLMNDESSRSHLIFAIIIESTNKMNGKKQIGKLSFIDLAGSERAAKTGNRGLRMIEGANINKSLLALGNCINMLHENNSKGQSNYIPFRDSKLTRLLKDSLGGNCRTVMIANIAPSSSNYEDTHNTLKYANRAKNIKTNVQRNVLNVEYHVS